MIPDSRHPTIGSTTPPAAPVVPSTYIRAFSTMKSSVISPSSPSWHSVRRTSNAVCEPLAGVHHCQRWVLFLPHCWQGNGQGYSHLHQILHWRDAQQWYALPVLTKHLVGWSQVSHDQCLKCAMTWRCSKMTWSMMCIPKVHANSSTSIAPVEYGGFSCLKHNYDMSLLCN